MPTPLNRPPLAEGGRPANVDGTLAIHELLREDSTAHAKLLSFVTERRQASEDALQHRYDAWDLVDDHMRMYADPNRPARLSDHDEESDSDQNPFRFHAVIPATYAAVMVRALQIFGIFTSRDPVLELQGASPEDIAPAKLMEARCAYNLRQSQWPLVIWQMSLDIERYGMAIMHDSWEEERGKVVEPPRFNPRMMPPWLLAQVQRFRPEVITPKIREDITRQFVRWIGVDPTRYWPDPGYPVGLPQKGAWCGHRSDTSPFWFRDNSIEKGGEYFNTAKVLEVMKTGRDERKMQTGRSAPGRLDGLPIEQDSTPLAHDHMELQLIPKHLGLSDSTDVERWVVETVEDAVIVRAHPFEPWHEKWGYSVAESFVDHHCFTNPGSAEQAQGMQDVIDWLIASRVEYTRKRINNSLVYAPALLEEQDLVEPSPGGHNRITQYAERLMIRGQITYDQIYRQLEMPDSTKDHLQDAGLFFEWLQRMLGTSDPQMAMPLPTKRTLGEIEKVTNMGTQRVAKVAELASEQALSPAVYRMIALEQQFRTRTIYMKVVGELAKEIPEDHVLIDPYDGYGQYNYIPLTGVQPPDPVRMVQTWVFMLETISKIPQLVDPRMSPDGRTFDFRRGVREAAQLAGLRHFDQFFTQPPVQPEVLPDEVLAEQAARGQVVPMDQVPVPTPDQAGEGQQMVGM